MCEEERKQAFKDLKKDILQLPRYDRELAEVLRQSNIQLQMVYSIHGDGYYQKTVMDSVINQCFGSFFLSKIKDKADSLFPESNRNSTFYEGQLDCI